MRPLARVPLRGWTVLGTMTVLRDQWHGYFQEGATDLEGAVQWPLSSALVPSTVQPRNGTRANGRIDSKATVER